MAELRVVTAISEPEFEGFVAGTLYAQGWNVLFRALDKTSLLAYLRQESESKPLLIYSTDLPGFDSSFLESVTPYIERAIGFSSSTEDLRDKALLPKTELASELLSVIRAPNRVPLIRKSRLERGSRRSSIIAMAGANHGDGVTMAAINMAIELTLLGKRVLLVDANIRQPGLAINLGERNINQDLPRNINSNLDLYEITRANAETIDHLISDYSITTDYIIFDLGRLEDSQQEISEKRWEGIFTNWLLENMDELWILTSPTKVSSASLVRISQNLAAQSRNSRAIFILNHRKKGRRGDSDEERFLSIVTPCKPRAVRVLSSDVRAAELAQSDRSILMERNPRSSLRREIMAIAKEISETR
jgi:MinD-like ATPase involved in chromosome partitioning or flagellar assembly